jgi:hypothetical protein
VDAACFDLHDEEHVQALEEHGVDVQKVTCQDAGRLRGQELPPGRRGPAWCRTQPGRGQNPTDRAFTNLVPESGELALDAPMTPSRVFSRQPYDMNQPISRTKINTGVGGT